MARETFPSIIQEIKSEKEAAESFLASINVPLETQSDRRIFFSSVQDRLVRTLTQLFSGNDTRDIEFGSHLASAQFHEASLILRERLHKGRLYSTGQVIVGSKVSITHKGYEFRGSVREIDDEDYFYIDVEKHDSTSALESYFLRRDVDRKDIDHAVGTTFSSGQKKYMVDVPALSVDDFMFGLKKVNLLKGIPKGDLDMRLDRESFRRLIQENRSYGVPMFASNDIFEKLVATYLDEDWWQPLQTSVRTTLENEQKLQSTPRLKRLLQDLIDQEIEQTMDQAKDEVKIFFRREKSPYTQNHYVNETLAKLRAERLLKSAKEALGDLEDASPSKIDVEKIFRDVVQKIEMKSIEEHMEEQMEDALRAYGKVAYKRFIDGIPMICGDAMLSIPEKIRHSLSTRVSDDELEKVLSLSPRVVAERNALKLKVEELENGLKILDELR
eukprot:scaffold657_cov214-Amphora_coffeaeformis.AAC.1